MPHHAYYIEDSPQQLEGYKNGVRADIGLDANDPDFIIRSYESFGIDDARELQSLAQLKKTSPLALFLLAASNITSEAQQALLKLFEEPQLGVVFVLLVPHGTLLPTLKSRCLPYETKAAPLRSVAEAKRFLAAPYKIRSDSITAMLKEEEWAKDEARNFLNALEAELYAKPTTQDIRDALYEIAHFRNYLADKAPSIKMILEHFAATLPLFK